MRSGKLVTRLDRYIFRQLAFALIAVFLAFARKEWKRGSALESRGSRA